MNFKERAEQISKETKISVALYFAYFLWWFITGYGFAKGDPREYTMVFGLPLWFFLSSVVGYVLFSIATIFTVKTFFKEVPLEEDELND